jgi:ribose transport system ATP-binding protein
VREVSFDLHAGEILGLAGLMGAGRSELARILFGLDPHAAGEIRVDGARLGGSPRGRIARGLAFLTEDRRADGLCLEAAIADNLTLVTLRDHARPPLIGWLHPARLRQAVRTIREAVRLTPAADDRQPVRTLSGGNQQKVVLAKWLLAKPKVLILDEPTRGIDVGAKAEVYRLVRELADSGTGVLLISSELEELFGLADRLLVMSRGRLADEIPREAFSQERVLRAALPA